MASVNLGRIKLVWKGNYDSATAYVVDDIVYNTTDGTSYICKLATTANAPTNTTYWDKMSQGANIGSLSGLAQGDILYYNGTTWTRLGAGTSGYVLKTNGAGQNPSWGEGLPTQSGNSGKGLTTNGSAASWAYDKVLKVTSYVNSTNTSLSDGASGTIWSLNVTKDFASGDSDLLIFGALYGRGSYSDFCGVYAHIANSTSTGTDGSAYYDIGYNGESASRPCIIRIQGKRFESLGVGTHTLTIGWSTRNGSSGDKPFPVWNPNSGNDARQHQQRSNIVVYEVAR
jgi:hypothetical protein